SGEFHWCPRRFHTAWHHASSDQVDIHWYSRYRQRFGCPRLPSTWLFPHTIKSRWRNLYVLRGYDRRRVDRAYRDFYRPYIRSCVPLAGWYTYRRLYLGSAEIHQSLAQTACDHEYKARRYPSPLA